MNATTTDDSGRREPALRGQTVVVIGGSAGVGLETARRARAEGGDVILTGRNPERLQRAAKELGARSTAARATGDSPTWISPRCAASWTSISCSRCRWRVVPSAK